MSQQQDDLHRRAVELRQYRMGRGSRPAEPEPPATAAIQDGPITTTFPVLGMTCRSCEVRIAKFVGKLPNVERVTASAARGQVTVECSGPVSTAAIERAIGKAGYEIGRNPWLERDLSVWATAGLGVLLVAALAALAQVTGIGDLASGAGELSSGGLLVALLLGLAAGVSTCMALVGGLVLGLSASFQARQGTTGDAQPGVLGLMRPALVFMVGRIAGYAVFGAALGAIGASITMPPHVTAVLMITVAIVMMLVGARLTGLSPRIAGWSPTLPLGLGSRLGLGEGSVDAYSDRRAAFLGAASFFLPCGFTQAIQVYALSTGSPLLAAALLGVFAIGTAPGLLALAGLPVVVPTKARPTLLRLVGVVVIGFAVMNASAGLRLTGFGIPSLVGIAAAAPMPGTLGPDGIQRITTYQDADGYSPRNVVIYAGYPVLWTMESSTTSTCAASLFAPGVGVRMRLELGPNLIKLPALPEGILDYTCAMGMYGGRITVVDRPADTPEAAQAEAPSAAPVAAAATPAPEPTPAPDTGGTANPAPAAAATPSTQELRTWQDEGGYGPRVATITAGIPTRWIVDSRSQYSCAAYLVVPDLGIERILEPGDNVIDLPAMEAGRLEYTCGMGMFWGTVLIEEPPAS